MQSVDFSDLLGKTINSIQVSLDKIIFETDEDVYTMFHDQACCENVAIEDICGDTNWLIGSPILQAEEARSENSSDEESWTFYRIATINGQVVIRWRGTSNGWYSMAVDIYKSKKTLEG